MMNAADSQILTIITNIVEQYGCKIRDIDLDNQIIDIDGPEESKIACALALEDVLG